MTKRTLIFIKQLNIEAFCLKGLKSNYANTVGMSGKILDKDSVREIPARDQSSMWVIHYFTC